MANSLRVLTLESLLDRNKNILDGGWLEKLGRTGHAAGDPGPVVMGSRGTMAVALSGVGDVAVTRASYADRFHVGRRPVDLIIVNDHLLIADELSDTIARIDLRAGSVAPGIRLGSEMQATPRSRGEALFFNARLSHDGWMSCHSCHSEGHTIGQLADTLGDGDYGAPKRIPSLLGSGQTGPWAWNGGVRTLREQVHKSVKTTMHGASLTDRQADDIVAFLKSLAPPISRFTAAPQELRQGRIVFSKRGCTECHPAPLYTSAESVDVGLVDENGRRKFNPPSLRGLGQRDRFFHDGRANRIEDVVLKTRHQLGPENLSADEASALIAFLKSL
jgi:cytochrome c peroxidase